MFDEFCKVYEYLFGQVSGYRNFTFKPNNKQVNMIKNFLNKKEKQLGENWIFEFLLFQFHHYHSVKNNMGKGVVQLTWVIGGKAVKRWSERSEGLMYYVEDFRHKYGLKNILINKDNLTLSDSHLNSVREHENIVGCLELNLFKEKNKICRFCKNRKDCYELAKMPSM